MGKLFIKETEGELLEQLAEVLLSMAHAAIADRGVFSIALAGGSTPKALYKLLASSGWTGKFDWNKILVFFGDERAVGPENSLSNYKMASEAMLDIVPVPAENVFRMRGEAADLSAAAAQYEREILERTGKLDVVLLGLGPDGHTASLFPHSPQLEERKKLVVATPEASLEPHVQRITLTYKALEDAREVMFLVTGDGKADVVWEILKGPEDPKRLPSQGVKNANTSWYLDKAAASKVG